MEDIKLSIIIPVYNEINTVLEIIRLVKEERHKKEIIVVDDCSTDGTHEVLKQIEEENIRVLFNDVNRGKGYGIRKALKYVAGDIVIIQDADLEYYPDEYGILIEKIIQNKADVVYGSRFIGGAHRVFNFYHYIGNLVINTIANIFLNANFTDLMTCYKAFRSDVLKSLKLEANGFGIETEITAEVFKRRYRVYEVPISYNGRTYEEGKKIRWTDFFTCLYWLLRSIIRGVDLGEDTLLKTIIMKNNNWWVYKKIEPFLGKKILELGSGIGAISKYLVKKNRKVTLTDINKKYTTYLKRRFVGNPHVEVKNIDILNIDTVFSEGEFDTIIGINILEHIEHDIESIKKLKKVLIKEGNLILLVPAHKSLFGKLDSKLGHFRRYSRDELKTKLKNEGFYIERIEFMNFLGAVGWFINFKLLRRERMSKLVIQIFDGTIPVIAFIERFLKFPFGLYLLCIAKNKLDF